MSGPTVEKAAIGIPDRWLYCPKMGQIVENLFVPFKTPLCSLYDNQIDKEHRFHPEDVFNTPILNGRKIGLWCDFTKTDRFYFKSEIESHNCTYCKIKMEGHGASPSENEVDEFILAVRKFLQKRENDELIAVHCTHGFNRTGFAIVSYLVKEMDSSVEYAIQVFSQLRPCGIYKQDYINDLFQRFGEVEDCIEAPEKPSWERGEDVSLDLAYIPSSSSTNRTTAFNENITEKKFMDGKVTNVYYVADVSKKELLRGRIMNLCRTTREGFPGLQPVSLRRDNIHLLAQHRYKVSWKADGMRYLVYITDEGEVYAFDRDNDVFQIMQLDFPHRKHSRSIKNTLLDAEMIIDVIEQNGQSISQPRLLIYDIIQFEEFHVGAMDYDKRSYCIDHEIVQARREAMQKGHIDQQKQSMSVRLKVFWEMCHVPKLLSDSFMKSLGHEIDGLIFQPITPAYISGRCDFVLKWKPPSHNSIDFLLRIKKEERTGLLPEYWGYLYVQHQNEPFAKMKATKKLQAYDNKIIECTYDAVNRVWCFMRERTDKSLPNGKNTAYSVWESIVQPITQEDLINYINNYCNRKRPLPPPTENVVNNTLPETEDMEVKKNRTEEMRILNAESIKPNFDDVDGALPPEYWEEWMDLLVKENKVRLRKCEDDFLSFLSFESVEYIFTLCFRMHLPGEIRYLAALYFDSFMRKQARGLFKFVNNSDTNAKTKDEEWEKIEASLSDQITLRMCSCIQLASKKFQYHTSLCTNDIVATLRALGRGYTPAVVAKSELRIVRTLNFSMPRSPIVYPESILKTLSQCNLDELGIDHTLDMQKCWDFVLLFMDMFFLHHDQYARILLEKACPTQTFGEIPRKLIASLKSDYFLLGGAIVLTAITHVHGSRTAEAVLSVLSRICHISSDHLSEAMMALITIVHS